MPKISVIVPVYNVERYLERCLNSLIQQTFQDFELICIDDGSTDQSPQLLNKYQLEFPHLIQVKRIQNRGLSGARNEGLRYARGEYVCFIDSDDWVHPSLLEEWYQLAQTHQADIVTCGIEVVSESGKALYRYGLLTGPLTPINVSLQTNEVCNKLYSRTLLEHFEFPIGQWYEDLSTVPILLNRANRIVQWNEVGYYYFQRKDSITKTYDERVLHIVLALQTLKAQLNWDCLSWHRLVAKHITYTLIRIASIPTLSERFRLYDTLSEQMTSLMSVKALNGVSPQEGWNAKVLIKLWTHQQFKVLDRLLRLEIKVRYQLRRINREFN